MESSLTINSVKSIVSINKNKSFGVLFLKQVPHGMDGSFHPSIMSYPAQVCKAPAAITECHCPQWKE